MRIVQIRCVIGATAQCDAHYQILMFKKFALDLYRDILTEVGALILEVLVSVHRGSVGLRSVASVEG